MNKLEFFPKFWKKLPQIRLVVLEKNAKNAHFNSKKWRHRAEGYATLITAKTS